MPQRTSSDIQMEIENRLGFFPPFFWPALTTPSILESLWQQTLNSYVENPIPELFKEKLAALISRYCTVPYCLICHSSTLRPLGMSSSDILDLLQRPPLSYQELAEKTNCIPAERLKQWPEAGSHIEDCILYCSVAVYLNADTERCQEKMREILSEQDYNYLLLFLAYNKTALTWAEGHPELAYEADRRVQENLSFLIEEEPKLKDFFTNYVTHVSSQQDGRLKWLTEENRAFAINETELRKNLERALKTAEAEKDNLNAFFMQAPVPMVILEGPDHRYTLANPPYEKIIGRKATGKTVLEVFAAEEGDHFIPLLDAVYKTGTPHVGHELPLFITDERGVEKRMWVDVGYYPFRDSNQSVKGILAFVSDVTAQVQSRLSIANEKQKLGEMIEYSPMGIALLKGRELVFEKVNSKFVELVSAREYIGKTWQSVYTEIPNSPLPSIMQKVFETGVSFNAKEEMITIKTASGKLEDRYFTLDYIRTLDGAGKPYGVMIQCSDVTDQILARQDIENAIRDLQHERELRDNFVQALTHDLRTPLTAAKMSAQLLDRNLESTLRKFTNRIILNMDRADEMIRDLLDAGKIKAGEKVSLDLEECSLKHITRTTIEDLTTVHGDRFELRGSDPLNGHWDKEMIRRVLENLLGNAVKYGSPTTPILLSLERRKDQASLSVNNKGTPIPEKDQITLFEPYKRSESAAKGTQKGWGIGLTLVRGFVEAMGGQVGVSSNLVEGTTFSVTLPLDSRKFT